MFRRLGYDIMPVSGTWDPVARRARLLDSIGVDVVLDVGANTGQYADQLRRGVGFRGRIHSFEPMSEPYRMLAERAADDPLWTPHNVALGDVPGRATINIAANSESSSLLDMLPAHFNSAPESQYVATEEIEIQTLDAIFKNLARPDDSVYLKVDTQGFEGRVLRGADRSLAAIETVQLEMPLAPLYEGEHTFGELTRFMSDRGYEIVGLEPGFSDPSTGRLLEVDGIFHRGALRAIPAD